MERIVEPELMEREDQVTSYAAANFSEVENDLINKIKYYLIKNNIILNQTDLMVDLGCGPGNISEKLSLKWPEASVLGIDGSKEMIRKAELNKKNSSNRNRLNNLRYICGDIKNLNRGQIPFEKNISLLVSNSLIHHITYLDDFFNCIEKLSTSSTINFHKDLKRPHDEKSALELREKCARKYNDILTNDYYASLKASYTLKEVKSFIFEKKLYSLEVFEEGDQYLIIYGKV